MNVPPIKTYLWKKKKYLAIILAFIMIGGIVLVRGDAATEYTSAKTERIDLVQTVSETGQVVANTELHYGWETTGRVVEIKKKTGDTVKQGELIARIENTRERARLNEGFAALASAQARLNLELVGPSEYDRIKSQASVEQARAALDQRKQELEKTKIQAQKNIDTAKKNALSAENDLQKTAGGEQSEIISDAYENLMNTLKSGIATLRSGITDSDRVVGIESTSQNDAYEKFFSFVYLETAKSSFYKASGETQSSEKIILPLTSASNRDLIDQATSQIIIAFDRTAQHLYDVQRLLNDSITGSGFTQTQLDELKSTISAARTSVATGATNVTKSKQAVSAARTSLSTYTIAYQKAVLDVEVAEKQANADIAIATSLVAASEASLAQAEAQHAGFVGPRRPVDVASLRAEVARSAANVQALRDDVRKTELIALADGTLAKLDIEVGETAMQNQEVVRINSKGLSVKVDISESDVSKLSANDSVKITLDAFGDSLEFDGSVASIESSETEVSGVVYYKTTVVFSDTKGQNILPGMTANVRITTEIKPGVLVVPQRAVLEENDVLVVRILTNPKTGEFNKREVKTGLRGDNGMVEMVNGLSEGEEVITFVKDKK